MLSLGKDLRFGRGAGVNSGGWSIGREKFAESNEVDVWADVDAEKVEECW